MTQNKVVGLTGGSGSGKSVAAKIFEECGAFVIDTDEISHRITDSDTEALGKIKEAFGDKVFEKGKLSRKALGKIVFSDKKALLKLNSIMHPAITNRVKKLIGESDSRIIIIDAPVLFAVKEIVDFCTETVVVCADEDVRIKRIMARDGISREDAVARISSQLPQEKLKEMSDFVIENNGDIDGLRRDIVGYIGK